MTHKKKRIFFRVDGDHGINSGLGHVYRSLRIYFFLKKKFNKSHDFYFISKNYKVGINIIKKTNEKVLIFNQNFLKNFIFNKDDKIIIDTLGVEKKLLIKLKFNDVKKILSFDDLNNSLYKKAIIINGIYFAKKIIKSKNKNIKIYQDPKYILLDEEFKVKKKINFNNKILVTSGGADKHNYLFSISKILLNSDLKNLKIYVLIGKGVKKDNPIFKLKNNKNVLLIKNAERIKKYLDICGFVIASGGTVMFEAIASGRVTMIKKTYQHQKYAINYFKKLNLISELSENKKKMKEQLIKKIKLINQNTILVDKIFKRNIQKIDGKGFDRIKKILNNYIRL